MVKSRFLLEDVGRAFPWPDFIAFLKHATPETALWTEMHEDEAPWDSGRIVAYLAAAIANGVTEANYLLRRLGGQDIDPPDLLPVPGAKKPTKHKSEFNAEAFKQELRNRYGDE